jgi:hypothetical protein
VKLVKMTFRVNVGLGCCMEICWVELLKKFGSNNNVAKIVEGCGVRVEW